MLLAGLSIDQMLAINDEHNIMLSSPHWKYQCLSGIVETLLTKDINNSRLRSPTTFVK